MVFNQWKWMHFHWSPFYNFEEIKISNYPLRPPWWLRGKESACNAGDLGSIPGSGRSLGSQLELGLGLGMATHSSYSCLENPMDTGAWRAKVHGVAERHDWVTNTFIFFTIFSNYPFKRWKGSNLEMLLQLNQSHITLISSNIKTLVFSEGKSSKFMSKT